MTTEDNDLAARMQAFARAEDFREIISAVMSSGISDAECTKLVKAIQVIENRVCAVVHEPGADPEFRIVERPQSITQ